MTLDAQVLAWIYGSLFTAALAGEARMRYQRRRIISARIAAITSGETHCDSRPQALWAEAILRGQPTASPSMVSPLPCPVELRAFSRMPSAAETEVR